MTSIALLMLMSLLMMAWHIHQQAWERARAAGIKACAQSDVELLDDTVVFQGWQIRRAPGLSWQVDRIYLFEFTADHGQTRQLGRILLGPHQVHVALEGQDLLVL